MGAIGLDDRATGTGAGRWRASVGALALATLSSAATAGTFAEVVDFDDNPGDLRMLRYLPDAIAEPAALVVLLHGCTQEARMFAEQSGWTRAADRGGFALLLPEQRRANNFNRCFNWFLAGDNRRDRGEAGSIDAMVERVKADLEVDRERVFVTGLSAGGAMTAVMLATYPEVFAGGAIVAGVPYGCADDLAEGLQCMNTAQPGGAPTLGLPLAPAGEGAEATPTAIPLPRGLCLFFPLLCAADGDGLSPAEWGDLVRAASDHDGPFPTVSIWHGSADTTVNPVNATEAIEQWTDVHGLATEPSGHDVVDGYPHQVFAAADGRVLVEFYDITGMGHGVPVDPGGERQCGTAGDFVLDVGICASAHSARFWGLSGEAP